MKLEFPGDEIIENISLRPLKAGNTHKFYYQDFLDLSKFVPVKFASSFADVRPSSTPGGKRFWHLLHWAVGSWEEAVGGLGHCSPELFFYDSNPRDYCKFEDGANWKSRWTASVSLFNLVQHMSERLNQPTNPTKISSANLKYKPLMVETHRFNESTLSCCMILLKGFKEHQVYEKRCRAGGDSINIAKASFARLVQALIGFPKEITVKRGPKTGLQNREDEHADTFRDLVLVDDKISKYLALTARALRQKKRICDEVRKKLFTYAGTLGDIRPRLAKLRQYEEQDDKVSLVGANKMLAELDAHRLLSAKTLRRKRARRAKKPGPAPKNRET